MQTEFLIKGYHIFISNRHMNPDIPAAFLLYPGKGMDHERCPDSPVPGLIAYKYGLNLSKGAGRYRTETVPDIITRQGIDGKKDPNQPVIVLLQEVIFPVIKPDLSHLPSEHLIAGNNADPELFPEFFNPVGLFWSGCMNCILFIC